jgi:hypothetical protein
VGKHAVTGLDAAMGIGFCERLLESKPLQQADRAQISRVYRCKKRANPKIAGETRNSGLAGFERDSAPPVLRCEDKGKIRGGRWVNGCLNVSGALAGA